MSLYRIFLSLLLISFILINNPYPALAGVCGDSILDFPYEQCDCGLVNGTSTSCPPNGKYCSSTCQEIVPPPPSLPPSPSSSPSLLPPPSLSPPPVIPPLVISVCGNHVTESPEQCDDGNCISGDGCSPICQWEVLH